MTGTIYTWNNPYFPFILVGSNHCSELYFYGFGNFQCPVSENNALVLSMCLDQKNRCHKGKKGENMEY